MQLPLSVLRLCHILVQSACAFVFVRGIELVLDAGMLRRLKAAPTTALTD
jgi:hypothetical protein